MPKRKEIAIRNQSSSCPNPSCGRSFPSAIKATNVGLQGSRPYEACPYCLTEIDLLTASAVDKNGFEQQPKIPEIKGDIPTIRKINLEPANAQGCTHHLGYLSERPKKEKISDECIVCEKIVQCLLKTMSS